VTDKIARKDIRKLFDDKEKLLKEQPGLNKSYGRFLRDWEQYMKSHGESKRAKKSSIHSAFGASFKEER
jgi:hypothetical protein